ncbi:hypothetical protein HPB49_019971 [Dermacentor silvarum]|uniref:Uncharacterized protein n=1 Tax=Dermacentor silvarum TaxID=543639 RepID=A0ACB8DKU4_DERSI|nr:hypothetical protein HPB49_019971 [Dermacentor silvarum]
MPYVVKKRQWERKMEAMQQQPDPESSPPRRASPAERPRGESKQRDSSRKRDDSKIVRSASRRKPSQSRERGSWADAVKANMAEKRQPPAQNAAKKVQEANGVEKSLRDENEKLKRRIAEQDATIKEINEKPTTLIAMQQQQQQQQQQPTPAQQRKQEMTEDEPEVEVDPRATIAAGPAPKRRAIEGAKERKITERIEKQGDRLDHLEVTSKILHKAICEHREDGIKRNLDAKYLPTTPTERHPDYQGNENETLDRDIEAWELEAATRIYDKETQLKAVQQVSAALGRQRPSETEDKGGGTPRRGAAALSDPRK